MQRIPNVISFYFKNAVEVNQPSGTLDIVSYFSSYTAFVFQFYIAIICFVFQFSAVHWIFKNAEFVTYMEHWLWHDKLGYLTTLWYFKQTQFISLGRMVAVQQMYELEMTDEQCT